MGKRKILRETWREKNEMVKKKGEGTENWIVG